MKVTLVNTHDIIGGAERCSYNLTLQLRRLDDDARLIVGGKRGDDSFVRQIAYGGIDWRLRHVVHNYLGWTDTTIVAPIRGCHQWPELRDADVYSIHNMHGAYWNFWTLPILTRRAPVFLTLHDEWLLTGDCAYTYDCQRWQDQCGKCPQASVPNPDERVCIGGADATRFNLRLKRAAMKVSDTTSLAVVAPTRWLLDQASKAPHLAGIPRHHVPYGVDLQIFRPQDKSECRRTLGLPMDHTLLMAPASNIHDPRKNFGALRQELTNASWPKDCTVVVAGRTNDATRASFEGLPVRFLGYLARPAEMTRAISACDATLVLSKADNLPYVGLESLACGRPVIGSRAGGIPEMINQGETGWIWDAQIGELSSLAASIASFAPTESAAREKAARHSAEQNFDVAREAQAYRRLFQAAIERRQQSSGHQ